MGIYLSLILPFVAACKGGIQLTPGTPTLADHKQKMRDVLTLPNVVFLDASESCQCIVVGISNPSAGAAVQAFAANAGVPSAVVTTVQSARVVTHWLLREKIRPIKGGLQIMRPDHGTCTMMATVFSRARGKKGLLTNSHCTATRNGVDGTDFYQAGGGFLGNDFVAREVIDPALGSMPGCPSGRMCRRSDVAYAEFTNSQDGIVGKLAMPKHMCTRPAVCDQEMENESSAMDIIGIGGAATEGEFRQKIGRTTGWTTGVVTTTCADFDVSNDDLSDSGITMLCQNVVNGVDAKGDSGSPVFELLQGDRVVLAGILWGGFLDGSGFLFTAMPEIEAELGAFDFF